MARAMARAAVLYRWSVRALAPGLIVGAMALLFSVGVSYGSWSTYDGRMVFGSPSYVVAIGVAACMLVSTGVGLSTWRDFAFKWSAAGLPFMDVAMLALRREAEEAQRKLDEKEKKRVRLERSTDRFEVKKARKALRKVLGIRTGKADWRHERALGSNPRVCVTRVQGHVFSARMDGWSEPVAELWEDCARCEGIVLVKRVKGWKDLVVTKSASHQLEHEILDAYDAEEEAQEDEEEETSGAEGSEGSSVGVSVVEGERSEVEVDGGASSRGGGAVVGQSAAQAARRALAHGGVRRVVLDERSDSEE